jgi:hypothetical protein
LTFRAADEIALPLVCAPSATASFPFAPICLTASAGLLELEFAEGRVEALERPFVLPFVPPLADDFFLVLVWAIQALLSQSVRSLVVHLNTRICGDKPPH